MSERLGFTIEPQWREAWHQSHTSNRQAEERAAYMTELREIETRINGTMLLVQPGDELSQCDSIFVRAS